MSTDPSAPVPNPVQYCDAEVVIGILAILEGVIWTGSLYEWSGPRAKSQNDSCGKAC
jgi:hypothetical protein